MESTSAPPSVPFQNKKDQVSYNSADVRLPNISIIILP